MYYAIDRPAVTELVWGGPRPQAEGRSLFPPTDALYQYVGDLFGDAANDPARSVQAFSELGWRQGSDGMLVNASGGRLTLELRGLASRASLGAAVNDMWRRVGIDSQLNIIPQAQQQNREYLQTYSATELMATGEGDRILPRFDFEASATPRNGYAGTNRGHYNNPAVTELLVRYRNELSEPVRGQYLKEIGGLVAEDLPLLPLLFVPLFATVTSNIRGLDDLDGGHPGGGGYFGGYARTAHLWEKD
jgi:ABC-type transport system substrate-binding protein